MSELVEIPSDDWEYLRELFKTNWPENIISYYTIDNFIRWSKQNPNIKHLNVYSLNGDWSDGTFLIVHRYQLFWHSLNASNERLMQLILLLDWNRGYKINPVMPQHRGTFNQLVALKNISIRNERNTIIYFMTSENAKKLIVEPPVGIVLKNVLPEHAEFIDSVWPNQHIGSQFLLESLIRYNPSIGAYNADGELIAWCLMLETGLLGPFQVDSEYIAKGLGSLVCQALTKQLGENGQDVGATVVEHNQATHALFRGIGFKEIGLAYYPFTNPTSPNFDWDEDDDTIE